MFPKLRLPRKTPKPRGDTILSVLLSVVIIGSVIATTYYHVNRSLRLGRIAQERSLALSVLEIQTERLKALLDTNPDVIFDDTYADSDGNIIDLDTPEPATPPPTDWFGRRFCLTLDESEERYPKIEVNLNNNIDSSNPPNELHSNCQEKDMIHFPIAAAEPRVEIRYQKYKPNDTLGEPTENKFTIEVSWTAIGSDSREKLVGYYRFHPLGGI